MNVLLETYWRNSITTLTVSLLGCFAMVIPGGVSVAQEAAASATMEEIIVTGSRISRDPGSYVGPMMVLDGPVIEAEPNFSLNDSLLKMPSIGAQGTHRNLANGGRGANFTGIHQLEPERTLTLWNGKRTVSSIRDTLGLGVDLQSFPVNMIDRVEILADGASAVYGSDAVAGVINLIPRTHFNGVEFSLGGGTPEADGGEHADAGMLFGIDGDRGFFTAGLTFVHDGDVDFQERDWSKIPLLGSLNDDGLILNLVGSGIPPEGRVFLPDNDIIFKPNPETGESFQVYDTFCLGGGPGSDGSGSIECILNQGHRFNYNDIPTGVSLISENDNYNFGGIGEYRFDNDVLGYVSVNLAHREGRLNFTPLPVQGAAGRFTDLIQIPFDNPNVPADALAFIQADLCTDPGDPGTCPDTFQMNWRGLDLAPRKFDYDSDTLSGTFGFRGTFGTTREWNWETWATIGRSELYEVTRGQLNVAKLQTSVDPALCAADASCPKDSAGNPTMDIFGRGPKTAEEIAYVTFDDQERTDYQMAHVAATITGSLFAIPAGDVRFAAGIEYRKEEGGVNTSGVVQAGDSGGNFAAPTRGDYNVQEAYAEFSFPFLEGAPLARSLSLDLAGRYSDYDTFGEEFTYKGALSWQPIDSLRIRGVISTGYRAPNILELFGGVADTFLTVSDPCIATAQANDPNRRANCAAAGVPANFTQPAAQLKISAGGNPDLDAETSDSFSIGVVWQPDFISELRVALDWYDVELDDAVSTPDPVTVISTCYDSPNGSLSAPECQRIGRGPDGSVVRFDLLNENLASVETSGVDLDATWGMDTGIGHLQVNWLLNWLNEYVETTKTGVVSDRTDLVAGLVSDWAAYPEWRTNVTGTLSRDKWSVSLGWRYLDEMEVFDVLEFDNVHRDADAQHYFDLSGRYEIGAWKLTAGVQNLTDEEPPYVTDVSANTSAIYDFLGRFYFVRASVSWK